MANEDYSNDNEHEERPYEEDGGIGRGDEGEDIQGKIFIGGLSWSTTEQTLRYYFEKYGELTDVALMIDKKTGKPRYEKDTPSLTFNDDV